MTKKYRIVSQDRYESEPVYKVQRLKRFFIFTWWSTYQRFTYGGEEDKEFDKLEEAKEWLLDRVKWEKFEKRQHVLTLIYSIEVTTDGIVMEIT